ncbi:MAG: ABC transporter permease [Thermomicrobiales bacterium]|nr:ABC transporter permease [Thermomicrobiales bacterium]
MAVADASRIGPPAARHDRIVRQRPFVVRNARVLLIWALLLALMGVYIAEAPQFRPREQRTIANSGMTLAAAGLGQTLVVLTGGIDLSVGPMVSLTNSIASATTDKEDPNGSMARAAALALAVGALGGLINGVLVAYGRLQPIIVTLATASIWTGIALLVRPDPGGYIPPDFTALLAGQFFDDGPIALPFGLVWDRPVPSAVFLLIGLVVVWLLFRRTPLATRIYAVGSSEGAAYMSGVNVARAKMAAYTLAGLAAGFGGLITSAQTSTGNALAGNFFTLNSIAAVVLGGASLAGGSGTFLGTLAGAYVIALIPSVLFFYGVSTFYQQLFQGSILLIAVSLGALGVFRIRNRIERL